MPGILVFLQHSNGQINKSSLAALAAAEQLLGVWRKSELSAVCLGPGSDAAADQALGFGLASVYFSEDSALNSAYFASYAAYIQSVFKEASCDTLVAAATSLGKELMPRLAAMLDAAQASDITAVNPDGTLQRPMYAGNVLADVELLRPLRCVTVRAIAFTPAKKRGDASGRKCRIAFSGSIPQLGEVVSRQTSPADRPDLADAQVVVSGGRGLESRESFEQYLFPLADALGAAIGASRAAVDAGHVPNDWQVGQTGRVVAPQLYIAVGISGAIQHISGMKDSRVVVAINKDPDAPIFEVADYGLVADLYQALPELTAGIRRSRSV